MANELVLVFRTNEPIPFTVANATGIEKGALLALTDPMTAATVTGTYDIVAGVAASEKIASDGKTKLAVYRHGIFKAIASGSIVAGDPVSSAADGAAHFINYVCPSNAANCSGSKVLGYALETAAAGETFLFDLNIGVGAAL